ncbi:NAD(P)-dependent oxidoreductase [Cyanobium sp. ATX 6F1]|uniref:NAD(P)-dependent oxidoreductase n=1 Tax=Cyanobium sp. ATX 6F1 TaxID=2823702 RepID=UPI0020CC350D|nr:NAD(P)-dependent oxidoreductase [Cyanobium sp. ATX 6F1]MCP9916414.1 NAD(P)-dependent oxidoreductase [Cyanobium sp. ATX 6F1]
MTESSWPPGPNAQNPLSVAFLGLGALGEPMAANLLAAGFALTVHNRTREREEPLAARGARRAATAAAAAADADLLAICVSDGPDVEAVLFGADGAAEGLRPGALVVDFSSIDPAVSQQLAARLRLLGVAYLDAPVTGGTEGARAGSLSVLVGGEPADLERARPLLEVVGGRLTHFGPVGAGQQAKAVNQVLVAGSYAAVAEALALARRLGLPLELVVEALKGGAAGSWALEHRSGAMLRGHFPLGFKLALHRKDLTIALAAAAAQELELPISARVAAMEDKLIEAGFGEEDLAALARWYGQDLGEGQGPLRA